MKKEYSRPEVIDIIALGEEPFLGHSYEYVDSKRTSFDVEEDFQSEAGDEGEAFSDFLW